MTTTDQSTAVPLITIGLDYPTGSASYDEDGEYLGATGTLKDDIVAAAARQLVKELRADLVRETGDAVKAEIVGQAQAAVTAALNEPFTRQSMWGGTTGAEITIRDLIGEQVHEWMTKASRRDSYDKSPFDKLLAEQVDKALTKELRPVIEAARNKVVTAVQGNAAALIADAVKAGLR